jgi:ABC-type polysaccharide/polyol phosphate transport system ATPase subunit
MESTSRPMAIITVDCVSKRYRLSQLGTKTIREELVRSARRLLPHPHGSREHEYDEFFALRDVSFEVEQGETVGFIGPNGSGKSTILKLLAKISRPTTGRILVLGSVASLIELGAGFHPELTGRENVYLYGSIMGMRRAEVRAKFDRIVEFAELQRFIDTPVKRYSSGMYVRLGFAVAAHVTPHVLLVDEVLAVGDAAFQSKCLGRIEELRRGGMTIVFVSHDMTAVERLCSRVLFLYEGQVRSEGDPQKVIGDYYNAVVFKQAVEANGTVEQVAPMEHHLVRDAEIVAVRFLNQAGEEVDRLATGEPLVTRIEYRTHRAVENSVFELLFYSSVDGRLQCQYTTALTGEHMPVLQGRGVVEITCDELGLTPGIFRVDATVLRRGAVDAYDRKPCQHLLKVLPGKMVRGLFYSPHRWRLLPGSEVREAGRADG